jgi:hypothetical protein
VAHPAVAFVEIIPMPSAIAHIAHVPISWQSKCPHFEMASRATLSKHPQCSHILYTCPPSYKDIRLATGLNELFLTSLPSSSIPKSAHALNQLNKSEFF